MRLLVIEDERKTGEYLRKGLEESGFTVDVASNGIDGLHLALEEDYDLVVLDVMLPGRNGLDVLRAVRARDDRPPVLMLTARGDDVDRIVGLELGADDYLAKPFNPRELVARMRAVLRRGAERGPADEPLALGTLKLDAARHRVTVRGTPVPLTGAEFRVLEALMRAAGRVLSREQLTEQALGRKLELYDRSVDTHVSNLRRKLALSPPVEPEIRGIRGAGYLLTLPGGDPVP